MLYTDILNPDFLYIFNAEILSLCTFRLSSLDLKYNFAYNTDILEAIVPRPLPQNFLSPINIS